MPNWYVVVHSGGGQAKVIEYTAGEDLKHAGIYDQPEKWKRTASDKYDPPTVEQRWAYMLLYIGGGGTKVGSKFAKLPMGI